MAIGRVNTGGGGSGGTLTVTGVAGHTVTAAKDGKTYSRTINSSGVAVFKGLATGTWTLTMTGDGQTATRTVDVKADYAVTITYFAATINITYPANSTCVVTNKTTGETVGSNTNTGASEKTWACVVGATGTYTITATETDGSGETATDEAEITSDGQSVSKTLDYTFYLFKSGKGFRSGFSLKFQDGTIYVPENNEKISLTKTAIFNPGVDLSKFSKIYCEGYSTGSGYHHKFGVSGSNSNYGANPSDGTTPWKGYADIPYNSTGEFEVVDLVISNITDTDGYIKLAAVNLTIHVRNIWLE